MRVGIGFDVHRLVHGRELWLGGIKIPYHLGLEGHSDADVLLHAIADSLLGAASMEDLGRLFPDNDETYRGISSLILLSRVMDRIRARGYSIVNIDSVVIAERPKLAPYIDDMKREISGALQIAPDRVGIKAKTSEGLGPTGIGEGIAAYAVSAIEFI
ncbi:MAG TPA: 2-C-methyl-D-erythritol 2,4-cyclodiphosphate synthase [Firmicutes bacterium]|nr:2-C-methyl-D-erythritol 2,4-cyclodiphosphate synthase [Bacillota bacterium]